MEKVADHGPQVPIGRSVACREDERRSGSSNCSTSGKPRDTSTLGPGLEITAAKDQEKQHRRRRGHPNNYNAANHDGLHYTGDIR
jgi:hypothetical protein